MTSCNNYIACDDDTKSEIVIPVFSSETDRENVLAVFDIDSVIKDRFDEVDIKYLEQITNYMYK